MAKRSLDAGASAQVQRLMYYSPSWQLLFEDIDAGVYLNPSTYDAADPTTTRTGLQVWGK